MLIVAGVIKTDPPHPKADPELCRVFNQYYERLERGERFDIQEQSNFGWFRYRLACHTLSLSNVAICTFATAGEGALVQSFSSVLIVFEEAPRATEADTERKALNASPTAGVNHNLWAHAAFACEFISNLNDGSRNTKAKHLECPSRRYHQLHQPFPAQGKRHTVC